MNPPLNFSPPQADPMGVLTSTAPVAAGARSVTINREAVLAFAQAHAATPAPKNVEDELHCTFLPPRRFCNYLLALEALNFCFWDEEPRWRVEVDGRRYDGYWALAAALRRAIVTDEFPLWDATALADMEADTLGRLLRGEGRPPPLLQERAANLREVGAVLQERWQGDFANLVESCHGSAPELALKIVADFPSFRDEAQWEGRTVRFFKRAQICVADLARFLPGTPFTPRTGLEHLTAFADYKVPQVMRGAGIIIPARTLAERIDCGQTLAAGSREEVELRAATIWGCEWIARAMAAHRPSETPRPTAAEVDYLLWSAGQEGPSGMGKTPLPSYHRTRTIFY